MPVTSASVSAAMNASSPVPQPTSSQRSPEPPRTASTIARACRRASRRCARRSRPPHRRLAVLQLLEWHTRPPRRSVSDTDFCQAQAVPDVCRSFHKPEAACTHGSTAALWTTARGRNGPLDTKQCLTQSFARAAAYRVRSLRYRCHSRRAAVARCGRHASPISSSASGEGRARGAVRVAHPLAARCPRRATCPVAGAPRGGRPRRSEADPRQRHERSARLPRGRRRRRAASRSSDPSSIAPARGGRSAPSAAEAVSAELLVGRAQDSLCRQAAQPPDQPVVGRPRRGERDLLLEDQEDEGREPGSRAEAGRTVTIDDRREVGIVGRELRHGGRERRLVEHCLTVPSARPADLQRLPGVWRRSAARGRAGKEGT